MLYVEAPNEFPDGKGLKIFLAGGITGCPNWQSMVVSGLLNKDVTLFNPRRENFPIHDPSAAEAQIRWEHVYLRKADMVSFWFAAEMIQPIVLYELGAWSMSQKPILVGMDPKYPRRIDVEIQTKLVRPDVQIVYSLPELIEQISDKVVNWNRQKGGGDYV